MKHLCILVLFAGLIACSNNKSPFVEFINNKTADEIFVLSGQLFFEECNKSISSKACKKTMTFAVSNLNKNGYVDIDINQISSSSISMFLSKVKLSDKYKNKKSLDSNGSDIFKS